MKGPLVSIIIPLYNSEKYVSETIKSALDQTWEDKEIIIVDNGSTDNSFLIARTFESKNFKVFSQVNKGASAARNRGLREAKGEYIQFLDANDLLSVDKIENQVNLLEENRGKISVCSTVHFQNWLNWEEVVPNPYEEKFIYNTDNPYEFLINLWGGYTGKGSMVQPNAWLVPREIIQRSGPWNEELSLDDDGEFFCRIILNSDGIVRDTVSKNYYRKFRNRKSLSASTSQVALNSLLLAAVSKQQELFKRADNFFSRRALANQYVSICLISYKKNASVFNKAEKRLKELAVKPNIEIIIGGHICQVIMRLFGWKLAKKLQLVKINFFS